MLLLLKYVSLSFSALLSIINPLGSALLFLALVGPAAPGLYRDLARRIAVDTFLLLLAVELGGAAILAFFGISLPVVQVAGGGVLAAMGWNMLNQQEAASKESVSKETIPKPPPAPSSTPHRLDDRIFYPLTFPLTAGPGTIVVTLTLSAHAHQSTLLGSVLANAGLIVAIVLICVVMYLSYAYAPRITSAVSRQTIHGILRIVAFILLCIGVQIAWNGIQGLLRTLPLR
jgi:multiple antibiotic resistance protein